MTGLSASLVILSRGSPLVLQRCLRAVSQLQYERFEVIVVGPEAGLAALSLDDEIKTVSNDLHSTAAARNAGIDQAAGEVVAFLDELAVPEPSWLAHLMEAFSRDGVDAAGGFVRGDDGISYRQMGHVLEPDGDLKPIELDLRRVTVPPVPAGGGVHTPRSNMAMRRTALVALNGFDTGFRDALEVTDMNLRLAHAGRATALVPMAEVHYLRPDDQPKAPRDLFEFGAGWAVFQRKHIPAAARPTHWRRLRLTARNVLIEHMVAGHLEPRDIALHLGRLDAGYQQGMERETQMVPIATTPGAAFQQFPSRKRHSKVLTRRPAAAIMARVDASRAAATGDIVTLMLRGWSPTAPSVRYHSDGYWEHAGAIYRQSDGTGGRLRLSTFARRIASEIKRVEKVRLFPRDQ
jgi:hypothetical protein